MNNLGANVLGNETDTNTVITVNGSMDNVSVDIKQYYAINAPLAVAVDQYVTPIFYLIGIPCNPLCAYIWLGRRTRKNNSSAIYLGTLSISHTILLLLHIFLEISYAWGVRTYEGYGTCELFYALYYCPQYLAPLLVLGFTVERYLAICHPFHKEKYCTVKRAFAVVALLFLFSLALSSVQAYLWTYDANYKTCNHRVVLQVTVFPLVWNWITELGIFAVAPMAVLVFNILVIREIRLLTTRGPATTLPGCGQNHASTLTLLTVSFYLICTWLPATLVYTLERQFPHPLFDSVQETHRHVTYYTVRKIAEEITLSNSACYFFIYYFTGNHFRDRVKQLLCPKRCLVSKSGINSRSTKDYIAVTSKTDNGYMCGSSV